MNKASATAIDDALAMVDVLDDLDELLVDEAPKEPAAMSPGYGVDGELGTGLLGRAAVRVIP